ncbi:Ricin B lectin [Kribbella flavida DSM 17836]|uniref:Ricin B lectin n=1 Tax=Kribbella flavida (strain DSM 17836 / JCM 10339 / NBRC 14399) TaxID=479435 RepID=D2PZP2_KRIFD|nr:Ricin B lectin [Kribbella flavida DSM 17836]
MKTFGRLVTSGVSALLVGSVLTVSAETPPATAPPAATTAAATPSKHFDPSGDKQTDAAPATRGGGTGRESQPVASGTATLGRPGPYRIQSNATGRHCLDSNGAYYDGVYLGKCVDGDAGQKWVIWNGGFIQRYSNANQCIAGYTGFDIKTETCDAQKPYQYWRHWGTTTGGFVKNLGSGLCLISSSPPSMYSCAGQDQSRLAVAGTTARLNSTNASAIVLWLLGTTSPRSAGTRPR